VVAQELPAITAKNRKFAETASDFYNVWYYTELPAITAKKTKIAEMALEVILMNTLELLHKMPDGIYTRQHFLHAAQVVDSKFRETQLRNLMGVLLSSDLIVSLGRNQYRKVDRIQKKPIYTGTYSKTAQMVIDFMENQFPLLDCRVWELSWLNEFFNHLVAHNTIFLEVEHEGCDFVFSELFEKYPGKALLRPTAQEILQYGVDDGIIIDRLVTEAPKVKNERYQVSLEKLIVDLFANKKLMVSKGDYPSAIEEMFAKYQVNQAAMFRYARRRNKAKALSDFLRDKTTIELLMED
jgi:hypothetical protein